jgi:transcriptional coactivator HFI1/ADA1
MAAPSVPFPNGHIPAPTVSVHRLNGSVNGSILSNHPSHPTMSIQHIQHANGMGSYRSPTRVDLSTIKQDLHDALGENGLPYWKALNGYLLGQIGKSEMESMVKGWLKGKSEFGRRRLADGRGENRELTRSRASQSAVAVPAAQCEYTAPFCCARFTPRCDIAQAKARGTGRSRVRH